MTTKIVQSIVFSMFFTLTTACKPASDSGVSDAGTEGPFTYRALINAAGDLEIIPTIPGPLGPNITIDEVTASVDGADLMMKDSESSNLGAFAISHLKVSDANPANMMVCVSDKGTDKSTIIGSQDLGAGKCTSFKTACEASKGIFSGSTCICSPQRTLTFKQFKAKTALSAPCDDKSDTLVSTPAQVAKLKQWCDAKQFVFNQNTASCTCEGHIIPATKLFSGADSELTAMRNLYLSCGVFNSSISTACELTTSSIFNAPDPVTGRTVLTGCSCGPNRDINLNALNFTEIDQAGLLIMNTDKFQTACKSAKPPGG